MFFLQSGFDSCGKLRESTGDFILFLFLLVFTFAMDKITRHKNTTVKYESKSAFDMSVEVVSRRAREPVQLISTGD